MASSPILPPKLLVVLNLGRPPPSVVEPSLVLAAPTAAAASLLVEGRLYSLAVGSGARRRACSRWRRSWRVASPAPPVDSFGPAVAIASAAAGVWPYVIAAWSCARVSGRSCVMLSKYSSI